MHANASLAIFERTPLLLPMEARLMPSERQSLALASVRLERVRGAAPTPVRDTASCRVAFMPSLGMNGRYAPAPAGTWIVGTANTMPADLEGGGEVITLGFPVENLSRGLAAQIQGAGGRAVPLRGAALMCLELCRSCLRQSDAMSAPVADAMADSLIELAKLAIIEQFCTRRGETVRETVRTRIQAFIHRHLADPDLSIERIAERMQCTKRYLHKVFSDEGETLNQYIWSQRLELCRAQLSCSDMSAKSITEIAFGCGFSNAAHFSRSFRARFGQSPRGFRRRILDQQA